ncbi:MATE family efflux transporter [Prosthecochloris sp. N3]|uniref:Multidrug export protein MepA n=1 Tax=Prosthecochloris ethylica TaxID=2743976 RepID=A0ABR9XTG9_9CHLB|nr:MATE family efflux transporter [Prosthecochloris ethylica]MBF0586605.1 MATE family efflux transporter [Prosthecochloris ethylica]MBF0637362.1 MATE family efflux transporter [Prosthecochloris ethylica]NUK48316.1 MATE family efflux transporter [Prosthecochloris ethylica]
MSRGSYADMVRGNIAPVFFYHAVPNVLGMLALSSSGIVDGIFVGNIVGDHALASINIIMPLFSLLLGVGIMFSVGGMVRCGKYIGEGNHQAANEVFSKTLVTVAAVTLLLAVGGMLYIDEVVRMLGANDVLAPLVREYLLVMLAFMVFLPVSLCLSFFVRVDGQPVFAAIAIISAALINGLLDWLFVGHWGMGLSGAAYATGAAHIVSFTVLLFHFAAKKSVLRFSWPVGNWGEMGRAAYNGMSEFANQLSAAVVILVFNWVMIGRFGVEGVAAFTIMHYLFFAEQIVIYGFSDALQPIISTNYGARKPERIVRFLGLASFCALTVGVVLVAFLLIVPEQLASLFLDNGTDATLRLTLAFISFSWPAFLWNGTNVVFSAYFTAIHKPMPSALIALSRTLVFPLLFITVLPLFFGDAGIFVSFSVAEFITFLLVIFFFTVMKPQRVVQPSPGT